MADAMVIDASLAASFLLREPSGKKLDSLLAEVGEGGLEFHVPALFPFEMANILLMAERRTRLTVSQVDSLLLDWEHVPLQVDASPTPAIGRRILAVARKHNLTAYDAAYIELAERLHGGLASLDQDLLRLRKALGWIL